MGVLTSESINHILTSEEISEKLSILLKEDVGVQFKHYRTGSFGNQNVLVEVISDKTYPFFLKSYPSENGNVGENGGRIDRDVGYYGYHWLKALSENDVENVPFLFGLGKQTLEGKDYNLVLLEDSGSESLEEELLKEKSNGVKFNLLNNAIKSLVTLHLELRKLDLRHGRALRKVEDCKGEFVDHIRYYLKSINSDNLVRWEEGGGSSLYKAANPLCEIIKNESKHTIHLDFHPGNILKNIIDFNHIGIGPKQFDITDLVKHPAVGWIGYDEKANQLVKNYLYESLLQEGLDRAKLAALGPTIIDEIHFSNFLKIFYFSNIIRNVRNIGFSSWLRDNDANAYNERLEFNPAYEGYREWYLKDVGLVLNALLGDSPNSLSLTEAERASLHGIRYGLSDYKLI